jgi:hypothetical protein
MVENPLDDRGLLDARDLLKPPPQRRHRSIPSDAREAPRSAGFRLFGFGIGHAAE